VSRVEEELDLLRRRFEKLEYRTDGQWVRLPNYAIPDDLWRPSVIQVAFQIPPQVATAPYAFHVHPLEGETAALETITGQAIGNYVYPATTPWGADWGTFSWQLEAWQPTTPINDGTTMLDFARSFAGRFAEGV
jgi:hypothetical protein